MCSGFIMENEFSKQDSASVLLELSAANDLIGFKRAVEEKGFDLDEASMWYGRRLGSKRMGYEKRTPLMIASMFGSIDVLIYVLTSNLVDITRACGSDGATALHCAVIGGLAASSRVVGLLVDASADANAVDATGKRPDDLLYSHKLVYNSMKKPLYEETSGVYDQRINDIGEEIVTVPVSKLVNDKKEYPVDLSLLGINNGIYTSDEFRMFTFKIRPCSRAYSHNWTECPFVHPGENARRRDPRRYNYSCVPCPEFRKGSCRLGDGCEYAHGIFECWLHPAQYRTRLCKDEIGCPRKVCFFAHKVEELRPLYASTGSAVPSPSRASSPMWRILPNHITLPILQLPPGRSNGALGVRERDLAIELLGFEGLTRPQIMDQMSSLLSPSSWNDGSACAPTSIMSRNRLGGVKPNNRAIYPPFRGCSMDAMALHLQSPTGIRIQQSMQHHLHSSYLTNLPSHMSAWGSPDGKLDWGIQREELSKLRKSASFGLRSSDEPVVSCIQPLVKDTLPVIAGQLGFEEHFY